MQRGKIRIDHAIIGSSDMDEAHGISAVFQSKLISGLMYKWLKKGDFPGWMKKVNEKKIKNHPDIRRHEMQHEELFVCHPEEWVNEVFDCMFG